MAPLPPPPLPAPMLLLSSVARGAGGSSPPLACEVCKIARFCCFLGQFLVENWKQPPPKEIGCRSREVDVVMRCDKAFEFWILTEKIGLNFGEDLLFFYFFWRPPVFGLKIRMNFRFWPKNQAQFRWRPFFFFFFGDHLFFGWKKRLKFRAFREISSQVSDKPCETDSSFGQAVCIFLTLSKKPPPFPNPGYAPAFAMFFLLVNSTHRFTWVLKLEFFARAEGNREKKLLFCDATLEKREVNTQTNLSLFFHHIVLAVLRRSVKRVCGAHLRGTAPAGNTAPVEEMSQRWRAVSNTASDLTGPRFEPQIFRSKTERAITHRQMNVLSTTLINKMPPIHIFNHNCFDREIKLEDLLPEGIFSVIFLLSNSANMLR